MRSSWRRCRSVLVVVAVCGLLSGCWLQVGFDAGHSNHNGQEQSLTAANAATLSQAWSAELLQTATEPVVRGNRVYLTTGGVDSSSQQALVTTRAIRATDGATVWDHELATWCCGPPTVQLVPAAFVGEELWTGTIIIDSSLKGTGAAPVRLSPADGSLLGSESQLIASPAVAAEDRVVQTWINPSPLQRVLAVRDLATRTTLFTATVPGDPTSGPLDASPPVVDDGLIVVAHTTFLAAYPLDGCGQPTCAPTWTLDLGAPLAPVATVPGSDDVFTIRGTDLVAVSRTGTISWTAPLGAAAPGLAIADGTIYVAPGTTLRAFALDGTPTWTKPLGAAATTSPVVAGGVVYVGRTGGVEAFRIAQPERLVTLPVAGTPTHLSVDGGRLFVVHRPTSGLSRLTAFSPAA